MKYGKLIDAIAELHLASAGQAARAVNQSLVLRNWIIGGYLFEYEQGGEDRAFYGERLVPSLAADLKKRGIKGLGFSMLKICRQFYRAYPQIGQSVIGQSSLLAALPEIHQSPITEFKAAGAPARKDRNDPSQLPAKRLLQLSWTHLIELIRLDDPWKRAFYENECLREGWSVRQLKRQIGSLLYERDHTKVEYATAGMDEQLFVSRYLVALPKPEELQAFVERDRAEIEAKVELEGNSEAAK